MRPRSIVVLVASLLLVMACGNEASLEEDGFLLSEGDQAPNFTLPSASGEQISLSDYAGQKPVLLYFSMGPG